MSAVPVGWVSVETFEEMRLQLLARIDSLVKTNNEYLERARAAEAVASPQWMRPALAKAKAHGPFADLNHVYGVLAEEMAELLDEARRRHAPRARQELIDIAAAALKAVEQIEDGKL